MFFSNRLDYLAERLYENLFSTGELFEKRVVVVGHPLMKRYLQCYFAKKKGVFAGIKIITLYQAVNEGHPSSFVLALELQCLLEEPNEKKRIHLSHELSRIFLEYGPQDEWQQNLSKTTSFKEKIPYSDKVHLFGFVYLEEKILACFPQATIYQLSPCAFFWGEEYSDKERFRLNIKERAENSLLANLGRLGKKFLNDAQDYNVPFEEEYFPQERTHLLSHIQQDLLELTFSKVEPDSSVELHIATSPLHEVEILFENISQRQEGDVLVLAPDISEYAPFIHLVFKDLPYAIFDEKVEVVKKLQELLSLPKNDFEVREVCKLFPSPYPKMMNIRRKGNSQEVGCWEYGFTRLLHSLGQESEIPLNEAEDLCNYIAKIRGLFVDLDLHSRSLNDWFSYLEYLLEKYFPFDEEGKSFGEKIRKLKVTLKHIGDKEFSFASIEKIFGMTQIPFQPNNVHAISFCDLDKAGVLPAKAIYLLGMKEGAFPRVETPSVFCKTPSLKVDQDRYLFIQLLTQAEKSFIMSYAREEKENPSSAVQELFVYPIRKVEHVSPSFSEVKRLPFIPDFCQKIVLPEGKKQEIIEIKDLIRFAKDPIRFYFNRVCKLYLEWEDSFEQSEFVVSNLTRYHLKKGLSFEEAHAQGKLPLGAFAKAAEHRFREEELEPVSTKTVEYHLDCDAPYEMRPNYWFVPALEVDGRKIVGAMEEIALKTKSLAKKVEVYPLLLIQQKSIEALAKYLAYYEKALVTPSPLLPDWAPTLLQKGVKEFEKKVAPSDFGVTNPYLSKLDFSAELVFANWAPYLRSVCADLIS